MSAEHLSHLVGAAMPRTAPARFPVRAKVIKWDGSKATPTVDVEVLHKDGTPNTAWPKLTSVPVEASPFGGAQMGLFGELAQGTIVRVAFYEGDPSWPYVDGVLSSYSPSMEAPGYGPRVSLVLVVKTDNGQEARMHVHPSLNLLTLEGTRINIGDAATDWIVKGDTLKTYIDLLKLWMDAHTHAGVGSPPAVPGPDVPAGLLSTIAKVK